MADDVKPAKAQAPAKPANAWAKDKATPDWVFGAAVTHCKFLKNDNSGTYRDVTEAEYDAACKAVLALEVC